MYFQHVFRFSDVDIKQPPCKVSLGQYDVVFDLSTRENKNLCVCTATEQRDVTPELAHALEQGLVGDDVEPLSSIAKNASSNIDRLTRLIRWKGQMRGRAKPVMLTEGMSWSADGTSWKKIKSEISLAIRFGLPSGIWQCGHANWAATEAPSTLTEPLAHEILREVRDDPERSPRSSVMVAVSAAECAMQQLVESKFGEDGIRGNPSLSTLLHGYVPKLDGVLRVEGKPIDFPRYVIERIERSKDLRDKLVHRRAPSPSADEVRGVIEAVNDFLYMLDVYAGHYWAMGHLSHETQKAIRVAASLPPFQKG